ncbi:hypothetical protein MKW98_011597 [Papaver atlanticum]|uniref:PGG domain-containing protein n=1 Tax=Papaver atlanticum TaxID=357466 RepID=A0AAD4X779_9MAGN|nr:hypothetical protein MKW98_011597 [Papaver atlanticum]
MASSSETTLLKLLESQVNYQQQMLTILTRVDDKLSVLINHNDGTTAEVGNNPASDSGQQVEEEGNHSRQYIIAEHQKLYEAAKDGDWVFAEQHFKDKPEMMTVEITIEKEIALHIAADHTKWEFVENLVQLMPREALTLKDSKYETTALHTAAMEGNTEIARLMVTKNNTLTQIRDKHGRVPLHTAAKYVSYGQTEVLKYLYSHTEKEVFSDPLGASLLCDLIHSNSYDIALDIVKDYPKLVTEKTGDSGTCALEVLVRRPFSFPSGNKTTWWQNCIYPFLQVDTIAPSEPGRSATCQMDTAASTDTTPPSDLDSSCFLQVCPMAPNGGSTITGFQVDTTTPSDLGRETIIQVDTESPTNHGSSTILPMDSMVSDNDFRIGAALQVVAPNNGSIGSSTVPQVDTTLPCNLDSTTLPQVASTTPSDLDRAGTGNHPVESSIEFSIMCPGTTMKLIPANLVTYFNQGPLLKKLCGQKLINEQANKLVSTMLEQIDLTMNKSDVLDFFKKSSLIKTAITYGTTEVVEHCLKIFPYLLWSEMEGQTMMQIAIGKRNEKIFNFLCQKSEEDMDELNSRTDDRGNTILHYAAEIAPSNQLNSVSGAALQTQREMQWFKGVEYILLERYRRVTNKDGITAQQLFIDKHKGLVKEGEKWMRDTSESCMLVATLISTVAFAAAFSVPGGNYNDADRNINGLPILLNKNSFIVFAIADSLALFSSVTSILMFLAILTSRYSEEDFLKALPQKFILGLATLFFSIATMMISFGSVVDIMVCQRLAWIIVPITILGCVPVTLSVWLLFPLFIEMIHFTYWPIKFHQRTTKRKVKRS